VTLTYALTDQVVVIGSSAPFIQHVLDTTTASSIASTDRYRSLAGRVDVGIRTAFVDLAAIRGLAESAFAGAASPGVAGYEQEVKPWLEPFDALFASTSVKGGVSSSRVIITVK
jgi:hypothetical protein